MASGFSNSHLYFVVTLVLCWVLKDKVGNDHPLFNLETKEIVNYYGYPFEKHEVITEDGYILELHRIPHGRIYSGAARKPVLIHHALLCSSFDWVINPPEQSLTYALADSGYDIWLANARGNIYSQGHVNRSIYSEKYWDFSFSEMGEYDLPASIDYILNSTASQKLHYIGHSMGTTVFFVLTSQHPHYNKKVDAFFALGPTAILSNVRSPIKHISFMLSPLSWFMSAVGQHWLLANNYLGDVAGQMLCRENDITQSICEHIIYGLAGYSDEMNKTMLPVYLSGTPAGTSVKTVMHFEQITKSTNFVMFDYQSQLNQQIYGQKSPPEYNVSQVTTPVYAYFARNDWMATPNDVEKLLKKLPNVKEVHQVDDEDYNHLDFMWGKNNKILLNDNIIRSMKEIDQQPLGS